MRKYIAVIIALVALISSPLICISVIKLTIAKNRLCPLHVYLAGKSFSVQEGRHTGPTYFFIGGGAEATSRSTPLF